MAPGHAIHRVFDGASGSAGPLSVRLRRVGEGLALDALKETTDLVGATVDLDAPAFVFQAPRVAADRYPDWSQFELSLRLSGHPRVWRIAEDRDTVTWLGWTLATPGPRLPLAAALWRGWQPRPREGPRALLWQGSAAHLWVVAPEASPQYTLLGAISAEEVLTLLRHVASEREFVLDVGCVPPDVRAGLSLGLAGTVATVQPFARVAVGPALREALTGPTDPAAYLPALGAALALLDGPPAPLFLCASSQEAAAGAA